VHAPADGYALLLAHTAKAIKATLSLSDSTICRPHARVRTSQNVERPLAQS
jgi:hypothetical protein